MENKNRYVPRQPIEIVLHSERGTNIGDTDGYKSYELESEISARKGENILLYLKKGFIPFSFYCISSTQKNNLLDVKETQTDGTNRTYTITIPNGNYNVNDLLDQMKTLLEAGTTYSFVYNLTYTTATSKVKFLITSGTSVSKTEFLFSSGTNADLNLKRVLGFTADAEFTTSSSAESTNVVDLADGLDSLTIQSNLVGNNIQRTTGTTSGAGELLIVPVDLNPNSILYFDDGLNPFKHQLPMKSFKRITMRFSDNNDNVVDFNNIPYTIILIVEFIQDMAEDVSIDSTAGRKLEITPQGTTSKGSISREQTNKNLYDFIVNRNKTKKKMF